MSDDSTSSGGSSPPVGMIAARIISQRIKSDKSRPLSTFYRNLEDALDVRRSSFTFHSIAQNIWQTEDAVDFCSGDILGLGASPERREEFLGELMRCPEFATGSSGVRLMDGNYTYLEDTERQIAEFHGAQAGMIVGSAYEANVAVWTAIPRLGDVIVYDSLVHASTHEGMKQSLAMKKVEFPHNNVDAFRSTLMELLDSQPLIRQGKRSILVAVESIYSMDGDFCPLQDLVEVAKEVSEDSASIQFVVDEAHSIGVFGAKGGGLVCEYGLQEDIAVVVHSFGKGMGATGAIILGNQSIKDALTNFGRSIIYTTSPSYPFVAAIKSGYTLLVDGRTNEARMRIQNLAKHFFTYTTSHDTWPRARQSGLLRVPLADGWEERPLLAHIITVSTRQEYIWWLYFALASSSFCVFPVDYPVVPLGQSRLRVILHATNTMDQVRRFADVIFAWVEEMLEIEEGTSTQKVSRAARDVYAWMEGEGLKGYGSQH